MVVLPAYCRGKMASANGFSHAHWSQDGKEPRPSLNGAVAYGVLAGGRELGLHGSKRALRSAPHHKGPGLRRETRPHPEEPAKAGVSKDRPRSTSPQAALQVTSRHGSIDAPCY